MKTYLIPSNSRFIPNSQTRKSSNERVEKYPPHKFKSYEDWFQFLHIDPIQRYIHLFGMIVGTLFYILAIAEWSFYSFYYYLLGTFFFYVLGIISHLIYDKGAARSELKHLHTTFLVVVKINFLTLFGRYDLFLRNFVKTYPFVIDVFDLVEIPESELLLHFRGKRNS